MGTADGLEGVRAGLSRAGNERGVHRAEDEFDKVSDADEQRERRRLEREAERAEAEDVDVVTVEWVAVFDSDGES